MNSNSDSGRLSAAGLNILTGLTVFQLSTAASALLYLVTALLPGQSEATLGLPRAFALAFGVLQVGLAALYVLSAQWAKGWMRAVRRWALREGPLDEGALARETHTLSRAATLWQWLPVIGLLAALPLAWVALGRLEPGPLPAPEGAALTPDAARNIAQVSALLSLVFFGGPTLIINWVILGWIRRWLCGVADAALGREARETRLPELAATLGRWFTFVQVLLALTGVLLLTLPWLPTPQDTSVLLSRLNLLLSGVSTAVLLALLGWSKTFLRGVTRRADPARG